MSDSSCASPPNSSNVLQRRYVHGPAIDEPIVWYEGSGTTDRRWLISDQLGSITAVTNGAGAATSVNTYDAYGIPNAWTGARFRYTGQTILPEAELYYFKARAYSPALGRFLQTDPASFDGGLNLYSYTGNDPVSFTDPLGLARVCVTTATRLRSCVYVDGDQDGDDRDDDLTPAQRDSLGQAFRNFILNNSGVSLMAYGKPVTGFASEAEKNFIAVISQFVGYQFYTLGGERAEAWGQITEIQAASKYFHYPFWTGASSAARRGSVIYFTGKESYGAIHPYDHPSEAARLLIHETLHGLLGYAAASGRRSDLPTHRRLDLEAIEILQSSGLGGWRCSYNVVLRSGC